MPGKPAARLGDPTAHGGVITGPGVPTVLIGKMPAATMGDMHVCPMVTPGVPPIPHVGGPIMLGSTGVLIGKKPAARMGDMAICVGPPSSVMMGCPTVLIGEVGSGSQAGSAGAAAAAAVAALKGPKAINPLTPPEHPATPAEVVSDIKMIVKDSAGKPMAGMDFVLEDPDGGIHLVATGNDGKFSRSGAWPSGRRFKSTFRAVTLARIDRAELREGDVAVLSATVEGYQAGTVGMFRLVLQSPKGDSDLVAIAASVRGDRMEARWTYHSKQVLELLAGTPVPPDQNLEVRLVAICGFDTCVGAPPSRLVVEPRAPVLVRNLRSA